MWEKADLIIWLAVCCLSHPEDPVTRNKLRGVNQLLGAALPNWLRVRLVLRELGPDGGLNAVNTYEGAGVGRGVIDRQAS